MPVFSIKYTRLPWRFWNWDLGFFVGIQEEYIPLGGFEVLVPDIHDGRQQRALFYQQTKQAKGVAET